MPAFGSGVDSKLGILNLLVNSIGRAAFSTIKKEPLDSWITNIETSVAAKGKFSMADVLYLPFSPPPVFWDYKCKKCLWWKDPNGCKVVEGEISPQGWCAIWVPGSEYKALSWPKEFIKGEW
jgi:hypothetical protein